MSASLFISQGAEGGGSKSGKRGPYLLLSWKQLPAAHHHHHPHTPSLRSPSEFYLTLESLAGADLVNFTGRRPLLP